ncbi:MAG: universal stress protein [Chloroflexi bacterium]|nr:universal stress protein [Chloroflexota bacterium]
MLKKILVTLDGSELAEIILLHIERLASATGAEVTLLKVITPVEIRIPTDAGHGRFLDEVVAANANSARAYLGEVAKPLRSKGVAVNIATRYGEAPDQIVDFAEEQGMDIVAMTTHGRSGLSRWIHGSVAEKVLRGASVPVLLVKATPAALTKHLLAKHSILSSN